MAYVFGESFDLYAAVGDMGSGFWDTQNGVPFFVAGRFAGSQALRGPNSTGIWLVKSSAVNDAVHHVTVAIQQLTALSGSNLGYYFLLTDSATNQCCVVFRSDGAILLQSGTVGGTTLATYTGAVTAANTWFAFEFEVVISATVGRFRARKNGNTVDDFDSGATLNTRPGANSYANKLSVGTNTATTTLNQYIDDLLWRSDASSVAFVGDIRCYTRMPASVVGTAQFAVSPNLANVAQSTASASTASKAANAALMSAFTATFSGTIASAVVQITTGATGNMKAAIYDSTRTTALATSNAVVNPAAGANTVTFGTPLAVTRGTTYHLAFDQDATIVYTVTGSNQFTFTTTYASFPAASPTTATGAGPVFTVAITPTNNAEFVNEAQQDGTTSYVFDANVGDADFYTIGAIASTPALVVAVTTRGFLQKSDAGAKGAAVQIKSGGTTVASTATLLSSSFGWLWRTDLADPATGAAWTATGVNNATIGPIVTS